MRWRRLKVNLGSIDWETNVAEAPHWTRRLAVRLLGLLPVGAYRAFADATAQDKPKVKSEAAAHALKNPPHCINAFIANAVESEHPESVRFRLSCRSCGSSKMRILCYPKLVAEGDDYAELSAGDVLERDPHDVLCVSCGARHLAFDQGKHGYDGALGHGRTYEQGEGVSQPIVCDVDSYRVELMFIYNIAFDELDEIATEDSLAVQDLFDAFSISAINEDGSVLKSIDYECA